MKISWNKVTTRNPQELLEEEPPRRPRIFSDELTQHTFRFFVPTLPHNIPVQYGRHTSSR
jgi:hypothetical protein